MKVKCITAQGQGILFKDNSEGLTVDKTYNAFAIHESATNIIDDSNIRFFIYNDAKRWKSYRPYFFEPVDEP